MRRMLYGSFSPFSSSDYSLQSLTAKGLIRETGRKDTIGRPILYGTTDAFLSHFGLRSLEDLPAVTEEEETTKEAADEFSN